MAYTGSSIVDYLKLLGQESSYSNRKKLASQMGMQDYMGTAEQNSQMLNFMRNRPAQSGAMPSDNDIKNRVAAGTNPVQSNAGTNPTNNMLGLADAAEGLGLDVGWSKETGATINGNKVDTTGLDLVNGHWQGTPEEIRAIVSQYMGGSSEYGALPGSYEGKYDPETEALIDKILNYGPFSYNPNTDPSFQNRAVAFMREGDRAFNDTIGDLTSMTGGRLNSWATSAASQAKNAYSQKLMDIIPELEGQAYNRYLGGLDILKGNLSALEELDATDYGRFRDKIADYENNRNYNRGVLESDRSFNRGVLESDRTFNRGVLESDRNYDRGVLENNRNFALDKEKFNYQKERDGKADSQVPTAGQLDAYNQIVTGLSKDPAGALSYINRLGKKWYTDLIGEDLYNQLLSEAQGGFKSMQPKSSFGDDDYYKRASDMLDATVDVSENDPDYEKYPSKKKPKYTDQQVINYVMGLPIDSTRKADILNALGI
jgi:hypothetical protein